MIIKLKKQRTDKMQVGSLIVTDSNLYTFLNATSTGVDRSYCLVDLSTQLVLKRNFETKSEIIKFIEEEQNEDILRIISSDKVIIEEGE